MINKEKILCKKSFIQKNMMINKKREKILHLIIMEFL